MTTLITADGKETLLDSGLDEYAFGKTNLVQRMQEPGYFVTAEIEGRPKSDIKNFRFIPWRFTQTRISSDADRHVLFAGKGFPGKTLVEFFSKRPDKAILASFAVCAAMTQAIREHIPLPPDGAGGILISYPDKTQSPQLLFLPGELFETAAINAGIQTYANLQGCWQHRTGSEDHILSYTRAVFAYRTLTGVLPYSEQNTDTRQMDICDGNFMPIEYKINGIDRHLASCINTALNSVHSKAEVSEAENFPLDILQRELGITKDMTVSIPVRKNLIPQTEFKSKSAHMHKKLNRRINLKRFVRHHTTAIVAGLATILILIIGGSSFHTAAENRPVSTGLTSEEVLLSFYTGMNNQNTELMQAMGKGHSVNTYINSVSGIFVAGKMRQAYEKVSGPVLPERWFYTGANKEQPVYGLTNFTINGTGKELISSAILRKTHPKPVTSENSGKLTNGTIISYTVEYFVMYSIGTGLTVNRYSDTVTLTYKKDHWLITDIIGNSEEIPVDMQIFRQSFAVAKTENNEDSVAAIRSLHTTFDWLPTDAAMEQASQDQNQNKPQ